MRICDICLTVTKQGESNWILRSGQPDCEGCADCCVQWVGIGDYRRREREQAIEAVNLRIWEEFCKNQKKDAASKGLKVEAMQVYRKTEAE